MKLRAGTDEHLKVMQEIAKLRIYADAERWLASPAKPSRQVTRDAN